MCLIFFWKMEKTNPSPFLSFQPGPSLLFFSSFLFPPPAHSLLRPISALARSAPPSLLLSPTRGPRLSSLTSGRTRTLPESGRSTPSRAFLSWPARQGGRPPLYKQRSRHPGTHQTRNRRFCLAKP